MPTEETEASLPAITPLKASLPGFWGLLRIWAFIGIQSFGGGPSTLFLIRREFIDRTGWLSNEEMNRFFALAQFTPGPNLIATAVLIGKKLGGPKGIAVSLAGLLLPSGIITTLLAALFNYIQTWPPVQLILKGVHKLPQASM